MAEWDSWMQTFVGYIALPLLAVFSIFALLRTTVLPHIRRRLFARFIAGMMEGYNKLNHAAKEEHFRSLKDVVSKSPALKNEGKFSLLEVGVGAGANLQFYPSNCILTVVDPNPHFEDYFDKQRAKFQNIEVTKFVVAYGEDMKDISDNSIDVVVMTLVMCSVRNIRDVLKEVKRVLVPEGKFYFWEHVADHRGTTMHKWQQILNPVWPFFFDGCEVNRKSGEIIQNAGFSSCDIQRFYVKSGSDASLIMKFFFTFVIGSHVRGVATK